MIKQLSKFEWLNHEKTRWNRPKTIIQSPKFILWAKHRKFKKRDEFAINTKVYLSIKLLKKVDRQ